MENWKMSAQLLVEEYIKPQGINNKAILDAMANVPRHMFLPEMVKEFAFDDSPLPIGEGQTISQPFIVAKMTELLMLKKGDPVLEIGTGSGYQAAVLEEMGMKVTTVERIEVLAEKARSVFRDLQYDIVSIIGDGRCGYEKNAPYQGIIVTAGAPKVEETWIHQLQVGGRIVVPVVIQEGIECLLVREKTGLDEHSDTWYDYCRFVPLLSGVKNK